MSAGRAPRTAPGRIGLQALRADPSRALIALDVDGTLAPLVADPARARLAPGAHAALAALAPRVARVALVTGRPAAFVVETLGVADLPGVTVIGQYGLQSWTVQSGYTEPPPAAGVTAARGRLADLLVGAPDGVAVEDKGLALVVHTRRAADPQGALDALALRLGQLADEQGLEAVPGRYAWELRPSGTDKGGALRALIAEVGPSSVLYAGDDVGDLPAMRAVLAWRGPSSGGLVVAVDNPGEPVADVLAVADLVVHGPAGLVSLLATLLDGTAATGG